MSKKTTNDRAKQLEKALHAIFLAYHMSDPKLPISRDLQIAIIEAAKAVGADPETKP